MGTRRRSRELALQFLYQFDTLSEASDAAPGAPGKGAPLDEELALFWEGHGDRVQGEMKDFASTLIRGTCANLSHIDGIITRYSENWRLSRMSKIDRNILRVALYELVYLSGIPPAVTINEAVELGKRFGTEESGSFINGILDKIRLAKENGELLDD
ncbi:MAG: transcription antitermination factor NusB [Candidatus Dadabacteria bacterium]|nr:transcription antitermination factor NusB [Candidatus Dadabacteria bacterium]